MNKVMSMFYFAFGAASPFILGACLVVLTFGAGVGYGDLLSPWPGSILTALVAVCAASAAWMMWEAVRQGMDDLINMLGLSERDARNKLGRVGRLTVDDVGVIDPDSVEAKAFVDRLMTDLRIDAAFQRCESGFCALHAANPSQSPCGQTGPSDCAAEMIAKVARGELPARSLTTGDDKT